MNLRGALLYVKDLTRMTRFYAELLGANPTNPPSDEWATFDTGGTRFTLHAIPAEIAKNIEIPSPPIPRAETPIKLTFEVEDVESTRRRLDSLGVQTIQRPWQRSGEACDVVDPEGNILQISSPSLKRE